MSIRDVFEAWYESVPEEIKKAKSETVEAFTKRLRDAQKHYMDSTNPKHPNYDPDMSEYFRGKAHGIMLAAGLIEDYLKEF